MTGRKQLPVRDDRGSVAVLTTFIVTISMALAVMLVEAGVALTAASTADIAAAEAARAAAIGAGPSGSVSLASTAARDFLAAAGEPDGTVVAVGPGRVRVSVTVTGHTPLLGIAFSKTATHDADLLIGAAKGQRP